MLLQIFHMCFKGSFPTIGDVKALNKQARRLKSHPVKLQFWPLTRRLRMIASYQNNENGSSQRGMTMFLAALRERSSKTECRIEVLQTVKVRRRKILCSPQTWQNCIRSRNVLVHASFSRDCGWTYLVKLQTCT